MESLTAFNSLSMGGGVRSIIIDRNFKLEEKYIIDGDNNKGNGYSFCEREEIQISATKTEYKYKISFPSVVDTIIIDDDTFKYLSVEIDKTNLEFNVGKQTDKSSDSDGKKILIFNYYTTSDFYNITVFNDGKLIINNFAYFINLISYQHGLIIINETGVCNINNIETSEEDKNYKIKGMIINNGSLQINKLYVCNKFLNFNHVYINGQLYIGYYDYNTKYDTSKDYNNGGNSKLDNYGIILCNHDGQLILHGYFTNNVNAEFSVKNGGKFIIDNGSIENRGYCLFDENTNLLIKENMKKKGSYEYFTYPGSPGSYGIYNLNKIVVNGKFEDEGRRYNYGGTYENNYKKGDPLGTYNLEDAVILFNYTSEILNNTKIKNKGFILSYKDNINFDTYNNFYFVVSDLSYYLNSLENKKSLKNYNNEEEENKKELNKILFKLISNDITDKDLQIIIYLLSHNNETINKNNIISQNDNLLKYLKLILFELLNKKVIIKPPKF